MIRKLSVWKWEISHRGGGCCGTGKLRDESPCGSETTGMSPTFGQTPPPRRGAHPPPPPTGLAQDSRAEATLSLHLCAGAGDANPPQSHPKSPHSICPSPIPPPRQPQWAEATEVPADRHPTASRHGSVLRAPPGGSHIPKAPTRLPKTPGTSTERGTLRDPSTPFAPRASPGPSPAPAAPHQGSPVLMDAAGSRLQDPPARAWHGGRGQPWHRHPWGVVDHPPAPPAGRGREGARKGGCGFESPRGKDVTPRVGPPRAGGCGQPPGRVAGGGLHPKEGPPALVGAPGSAPPAAPRSCCASGLASPRKQK